jgi:hypothetical protein
MNPMKGLLTCVLWCIIFTTAAQQKNLKPLNELIDPDNTGWIAVSRMIESAKDHVEVLGRDAKRADSTIYQTQISTDNPLGGVIYNTGGILIEGGWVRILGSGCDRMNRGIGTWNKGKSYSKNGNPAMMLIADDVIGGFFAINTGGIDEINLNKVFYFGPNSLKWEFTGLNYLQFISFCFSDQITEFYTDFRWKGWQQEVSTVSTSNVISVYPLFWTKDGREIKSHRKVLPVQKMWDTYLAKHKTLTDKVMREVTYNPAK